jgi:hypothetical protein
MRNRGIRRKREKRCTFAPISLLTPLEDVPHDGTQVHRDAQPRFKIAPLTHEPSEQRRTL